MGTDLVVLNQALSDKALPSRFNGNRFDKAMKWAAEKEYATQVFKRNVSLQKCTPESVRTSMLEVAWSGMSLAPSLGHAYLIPYGDGEGKDRTTECTFAPGYRGMAYMGQKGGAVKGFTTGRVMANDEFRVFLENNRRVVQHKEDWKSLNRGPMIATYCIAHLASGEDRVEVTPATIIKAAEAAAVKKNPKGGYAWKGDFRDQMEIKVAIRRCMKLIPSDPSGWLQHAMEVVDKHDGIDFGPPPQEASGAQEIVISDDQALRLHAALTTRDLSAADADVWLANLAAAFGLRRISDLPAKHFDEAMARLVKRYEQWADKHG